MYKVRNFDVSLLNGYLDIFEKVLLNSVFRKWDAIVTFLSNDISIYENKSYEQLCMFIYVF